MNSGAGSQILKAQHIPKMHTHGRERGFSTYKCIFIRFHFIQISQLFLLYSAAAIFHYA